jgi:methyl-accepting chemotaxis protein
MDKITQANAGLVDDINMTGRALSTDAEALMRQVAFFRLPDAVEDTHEQAHEAPPPLAVKHSYRVAAAA